MAGDDGGTYAWSDSVEDLIDEGDVDGAISLLEAVVSKLETLNVSSSETGCQLQLSTALSDLARLHSSRGFSLKADELRSRAILIRARASQPQPPRPEESDSFGEKFMHLEENGNASSSNQCVEEEDADWEAIADRSDSSGEVLVSPQHEKGSASVPSKVCEGTASPRRRGRGSFLYKRNQLYSDQLHEIMANRNIGSEVEEASTKPSEDDDTRTIGNHTMKPTSSRQPFKTSAIIHRPTLTRPTQNDNDNEVHITEAHQLSTLGRIRAQNWSESDKETLLLLLHEHATYGCLVNGNPTSITWHEIMLAFKQATGVGKTTQQLKDGWKNLKREYRKYHDLASRSEWGWDYDTALPLARDDAWKELLQTNPELRTLRHKSFPFYKIINELTKNTFATGCYARSSQQQTRETQSPSREQLCDDHEKDAINDFAQQDTHANIGKRQCSDAPAGRRKRALTNTDVEQILDELRSRSTHVQAALHKIHRYSYEDSISKLQGMQNLSTDAFLAMVDMLENNPDKRTALMVLDGERLKRWIEMQVKRHTEFGTCIVWDS